MIDIFIVVLRFFGQRRERFEVEDTKTMGLLSRIVVTAEIPNAIINLCWATEWASQKDR